MRRGRGFTLIELLFVVAVIATLAAIAVPNFLEAQVRSKVARTHSDMAAVSMSLRSYFADFNRYPPNNPEVRSFLDRSVEVEEVNNETVPTPADAKLSWTGGDPLLSQRVGAQRQSPGDSVSAGASSYSAPAISMATIHEEGFSQHPFPVLISASYDLRSLTTPVAYHSGPLPGDPFHDRRGHPFLYLNYADLDTTSPTTPGGRLNRYLLLSYGPDTDSRAPDFTNPVKGPFVTYDPTNGTVSNGDILHFGDHSPQQKPGEGDAKGRNRQQELFI